MFNAYSSYLARQDLGAVCPLGVADSSPRCLCLVVGFSVQDRLDSNADIMRIGLASLFGAWQRQNKTWKALEN